MRWGSDCEGRSDQLLAAQKQVDTLKLELRRSATQLSQTDAVVAAKDKEIAVLRAQLRKAGAAQWEGNAYQLEMEAELEALRSQSNRSHIVQQLQAKNSKLEKYRARLEGELQEAQFEVKEKRAEVERLNRQLNGLIDRTANSERDTTLMAYRPGIPTGLDTELDPPSRQQHSSHTGADARRSNHNRQHSARSSSDKSAREDDARTRRVRAIPSGIPAPKGMNPGRLAKQPREPDAKKRHVHFGRQ